MYIYYLHSSIKQFNEHTECFCAKRSEKRVLYFLCGSSILPKHSLMQSKTSPDYKQRQHHSFQEIKKPCCPITTGS